MTALQLNDDSMVKVNPEVICGDVDGEIVALNMQLGSYLHLNSSGSFIFSLLDNGEPQCLSQMYQRVGQEYEVDDLICRREVAQFIERCIELELISDVS